MSDQPPESPAGFQSSGVSADATTTTVLSPQAQEYLNQTRPWVRFISIMVFVGAAFMALAALVMIALTMAGAMAARGAYAPFGAVGVVAAAFFYLMLACLYIAPGVFLYRYASAIKQLKAACTASALEDALKHQKSFWRFIGILTAVSLVIVVLVLVIAIVAGVLGVMMSGRR
jgi:hypothetical protein